MFYGRPLLFVRRFVALLLSISALVIIGADVASGQSGPQTIDPGQSLEISFAGGQKSELKIDCSGPTYARLTVEQQGIDVSGRVFDTKGTPVLEFEAEPRMTGEETLELLCSAAGPFNFTIESRQRGAAPGKIRLTYNESRPATDKDKALDEARRLLVSATQKWRAAKYAESMPDAVKCLEIRERELGPDHPDVGLALFTVGNIYSDLPDYPKAEDYYKRAIANRSKALGPDHLSLAAIYNNYGLIFKDMARYPEAIAMFEKALAIRERSLSPDHLLVASVLNNLAIVQRARGDGERAQELYARVLAIREKALGPDHPDVATSIQNLVDSSWAREKAEPLYLRALAIREAKLRPDHPEIGQSLYNLGMLYAAYGEFDKAESYCRRALDVFKKSLGPEHPYTTLPMNLLAVILRGKGEFEASERLFDETIALKEKAEGPYHPHLGGTLANAANLYLMMGKTEKALKALERSSAIFDYNIRLNMASGSEKEKIDYLDQQSAASDLALTIAFGSKDVRREFVPLSFASVLQRKGRVLDSMSANVAALRTRLNADDRELLDSWNAANTRIAKFVVAGPGGDSPDTYRKKLSDLEAERDRLENALSSKAGGLAANAATVTTDKITASIPAGAALVEFVKYRPVDRARFEFAEGGPSSAISFRAPRYAAFVVRSSGEIEAVDLGECAVIDNELQVYRMALRDRLRNSFMKAGSTVGSKIFEPLRKAIGTTEHLIISPDGDLNLIPFEALSDAKGKFLVENYSITYVTSGRDLVKQTAGVAASDPVIVADPDFGGPIGLTAKNVSRSSVTATRNFEDTFFAPLSGTADEVRSIRTMFPTAKVFEGESARESEVRKVAAPKFLHIATHGFFVDNPVGLVGSGADGARGQVPSIAKRNPLLRSGLALAGANMKTFGDDDGILTALEVTGLDLRGTRLVVLSACDTGVGTVRSGEGVFGLRRAFKLAGAESLVMSLWPVSDQVTKELMSGYYRNLKQGIGRGESLRRVQLEMIAKPARRHPFYWASFIQAGDWTGLESAGRK